MKKTPVAVKRIFAVFVLIFAANFLSALDFSMHMEPYWTIQYGSVQEYVWAKGGASDYKVSELLWDLKPVWAGGFRVSAILEGFELSGDFTFGLTGKVGQMQDSDWLNMGQPSPLSSYKTHYSSHTNYLTQYMNISGSFGYNFKLPHGWTVAPFLTFVHRVIAFDSKDGTADYPSSSNAPYTAVGSGENRQSRTFKGSVISYEQYVQYFSLGASATWNFHQKWKVGGSLSFIPLIFATGYDNHWLTRKEYIDVMYGGLGVSGKVHAAFVLDKSASINLGVSAEYIGNLKGPDFMTGGSTDAGFNTLREARKSPMYALYLADKGIKSGALSPDPNGLGGAGQFIFTAFLSITLSF